MRSIALLITLVIALSLFPYPVDGSNYSLEIDGMDRIVGSVLRSVSASAGDSPIFPPLDATSLIRQEMEKPSNSPTRTDPIPISWDLAESFTYSDVYVEEGEYVPPSDINAIGSIFDESIYPNATSWFHPSAPFDKIDIRIYDFGDGPGNVGGFFYASFATRDDMYVDSQDLEYSREWTFEIVAHEFQHLLHYDLDRDEEIWLNEGLADLSARVCLGPGTEGIQSHIDAYESYPDNDLIVWGEGEPPDNIETIADYGRSYAFVSFLAHHFGGRDLIIDLVADTSNSISSIDAQLAANGLPERFGDVLMRESVANVFDDPDYGGGIYHQGLIDIGLNTYENTAYNYPSSYTIESESRYSPFVLRYGNPSPGLGILIESSSAVEGTIIGLSGDEIVRSVNFTNHGSGEFRYRLSGFGTDYDMLYVIPHKSSSSSSISVIVEGSDLEPPVTDVSISPPEPDGKNDYYVTSPSVMLTAPEDSTVKYAYNDEPFETYTQALHPPEGINVLRFYSEGTLGLIEEERQITFRVDLTDPGVEMIIDPEVPDGENGYYITSPTLNFSTDEDAVVLYDMGEGEMEFTSPLDIPGGVWEIRYWAEDVSGRSSELNILDLKVDLSDPAVSYAIDPISPDGVSGYYVTQPLITIIPEGASVGYYSLNGGDPVEYTDPFNLDDGEWELSIFARDPSGASSGTSTEFLKVDTTEPDLSFSFSRSIDRGWISDPVYLSLSSGDPLADIFFRLGEEGPFGYSNEVLLGDGNYTVEFWAEDQAGNRATGGTRQVRIDTTTPSTLIDFDRPPDSGVWYHDTAPGISFRSSGPTVSRETVFVSVNSDEFREWGGSAPEFVPGENTIRFYSVDMAGNREETRVRDIGLDTAPPSPSFSANRTLVPVRGSVLFSIEGSTDDIEVYRFRVDFGDGSSSDWIYGEEVDHFYSGTGEYVVTLTIEDIAGRSVTLDGSLTVEVLTQKEYDERMKGDRTSLVIMVSVSILILAAIISVMALAVVLVRRKRTQGVGQAVEVEWEEDWN